MYHLASSLPWGDDWQAEAAELFDWRHRKRRCADGEVVANEPGGGDDSAAGCAAAEPTEQPTATAATTEPTGGGRKSQRNRKRGRKPRKDVDVPELGGPPSSEPKASSPPLTHFLSLPLQPRFSPLPAAAPLPLSPALTALHGALLAANPHLAPALIPRERLHVTLGVMSLSTTTLPLATQLLDGVPLPAAPLDVVLNGVHTMSHSSGVLYSAPAADGLLEFAEELRRRFADAGLLQDYGQPLKLHVTLANTRYIPGARRKRPERRVDFSAVLAEFKDCVLGEVGAGRVVICEMGARVLGREGEGEGEGEQEHGVKRYVEVYARDFTGTGEGAGAEEMEA